MNPAGVRDVHSKRFLLFAILLVTALGAGVWFLFSGEEERPGLPTAGPSGIPAEDEGGSPCSHEREDSPSGRNEVRERLEALDDSAEDAERTVPSFVLRGKVIDEEGRLVAGARVQISVFTLATEEASPPDPYRFKGEFEGLSREDGTFEIEVPHKQRYYLCARKPGYVPCLTYAPAGWKPVLVLRKGVASFRGWVKDDLSGKGVAGARVVLFSWDFMNQNRCETVTARDGSFLFENVPRVIESLEVRKEGYGKLELQNVPAAKVSEKTWFLTPLEGERKYARCIARDSGTPLPRVEVNGRSSTADAMGRHLVIVQGEAYGASSGDTIVFHCRGFCRKEVPLSSFQETVTDVYLDPAVTCTLQVVDEANRPVEGVNVSVEAEKASAGEGIRNLNKVEPVESDRQGWCTLTDVPIGIPLSVILKKGEYPARVFEGIVVKDGYHTFLGTFSVYRNYGRITGRVTDENGPLPRAWVGVKRKVGRTYEYLRDITGEDGCFEIPVDRFQSLICSMKGYAVYSLDKEIEVPPGTCKVFDIHLQKTLTIRGQVVDGKGRPVPGACVENNTFLYGNSENPTGSWRPLDSAICDESGRFELLGAQAGRKYSLMGFRTRVSPNWIVAGGKEVDFHETVAEAGARNVRVIVNETGHVLVEIRERDRLMTGRMVLVGVGGPGGFVVPDGYRSLELMPGAYNIHISSKGYETVKKHVIVAPGEFQHLTVYMHKKP